MIDKSWHFTRALIEKFHGKVEPLKASFSPGLADKLEQTQMPKDKGAVIPSGFIDIPFGLGGFHFSWALPLFQDRSDFEKALFISVLPPDIGAQLRNRLKIKERPLALSPQVRKWVYKEIIAKICPHVLFSEDIIEDSPISRLQLLSKRELELLSDYMGLFDLAEELRKVIDKPTITKVYAELSSKEIVFLEQCLTRRFLWRLPPIGLETWLKNPSGFRHVLQKRGLARLCVGLSGEDPFLIEKLIFTLDMGRAKILKHLVKSSPIEPATTLVQKQVIELFDLLFANHQKLHSG